MKSAEFPVPLAAARRLAGAEWHVQFRDVADNSYTQSMPEIAET